MSGGTDCVGCYGAGTDELETIWAGESVYAGWIEERGAGAAGSKWELVVGGVLGSCGFNCH